MLTSFSYLASIGFNCHKINANNLQSLAQNQINFKFCHKKMEWPS